MNHSPTEIRRLTQGALFTAKLSSRLKTEFTVDTLKGIVATLRKLLERNPEIMVVVIRCPSGSDT